MKTYFMILLALIPVMLSALSVNASVNKNRIELADRLEYSIQIKSDSSFELSEPKAPTIELFSFVNMSSSTRSSSTIINFRTQREYIRTYTYSYVPLREGSSTIPGQNIRVGNKVYTTQPITVTVVKSSSSPSVANPLSPGGSSFTDPDLSWHGGRLSGNTMIIAEPRRQTVYKGQPTIVSYYLYTDQMVRSFSLKEERDFPGYGKSLYEQPNSLSYEVVTYQGKRYQRALIKQLVLSPNETGELRAPEISGSARIYEFGYMSQTVRSADAWLDVLPLPKEGVAAGFTGAVGKFQLSEDVSSGEISLGEALTFSLRIAGRGNFNQFGNPTFPETNAQVSSPLAVDKLTGGIEGSRVLYYTIIPSEKGIYELPSFSFSWFDHSSGTYRTYQTQTRQIKVKSANVISYFSGLLEGNKVQTLRPMLSRSAYPQYSNYLKEIWFWLIVALILVGTGVALYLSLDRIKRAREPELYARLMADKVLKKYLSEAERVAKVEGREFYGIAENNLMRYLSEKYGIANGLSTSQKMELLAQKQIPPGLIVETQSFIDACERNRFAPLQTSPADIQRDLMQLKSIVYAYSRLGGKF